MEYLGSERKAGALFSEDRVGGAGGAVGRHEGPAGLGLVGEGGVVQAHHVAGGVHAGVCTRTQLLYIVT